MAFFVVTRDHDTDGVPYAGVRAGGWNQQPDAAVYYARRFSTRILEQCLRDSRADVIWLNSFFSRASLRVLLSPRLRRLRRPILLAPRGEFSPGALALKPHRKRLAIDGLNRAGLLDRIHWIASSPAGANEIRSVVGASSIAVVPESVAASTPPPGWPVKPPGRLRAVCASRITPMKNQQFLLDVLAQCRGAIDVDLIGPIDDHAYWAECQRRMARLPSNVTVSHLGELDHAELLRRLPAYDALVLPTRGENFGHVIVEAWSAGCPVVISDRTQWRHLADDRVGWDLPLDEGCWVDALQRLAGMTNGELLTLRNRAIERARHVCGEGHRGDEALRELILRMAPRISRTGDPPAPRTHDAAVADLNTCA